jgi:hypothetical protein
MHVRPLTGPAAQAATLAQQGASTADIAAQLYPDAKPASAARNVRRHLAAARAVGVATEPQPAPEPAPGPAPAKRKGRVLGIGLSGGGAPAEWRRVETKEQFDRRTQGAGRTTLGPDLRPGDLERDSNGEATGRYLIGSAAGMMAPRSALDAFREGPPPGAAYRVGLDEDGNVIEVEPV